MTDFISFAYSIMSFISNSFHENSLGFLGWSSEASELSFISWELHIDVLGSVNVRLGKWESSRCILMIAYNEVWNWDVGSKFFAILIFADLSTSSNTAAFSVSTTVTLVIFAWGSWVLWSWISSKGNGDESSNNKFHFAEVPTKIVSSL